MKKPVFFACIAFFAVPVLAFAQIADENHHPVSEWVHYDRFGYLVYKQTPKGDTIMDYSAVGYDAGRNPIPFVPARRRVKPSGGDDTAAIQSALDAVAKLPLKGDFRGAVELAPGSYHVSQTLTVTVSGVVLRGSGSGKTVTVIKLTGTPHLFFSAAGVSSSPTPVTDIIQITDDYVPAGARSFHVSDTSQLYVGQPVIINRIVSDKWIDFMGMYGLYGTTANGTYGHQVWEKSGYTFITPRVIADIRDDKVTLDVPLSDSIDSAELAAYHKSGYTKGGELYGYSWPELISHVGIEHMQIVGPPQAVDFDDAPPVNSAVSMQFIKDGWVRDLGMREMLNAITISPKAYRMTVEHTSNVTTVVTTGSGHYFDYIMAGSQDLMEHVYAKGDHITYFATQSGLDGAEGPMVLHDALFEPYDPDATGVDTDSAAEPHQRWATGLLLDNVEVPDRSLNLLNRGSDGTGQGWAIGWGTAWNSNTKKLIVEQPPGAYNWCIGCTGKIESATNSNVQGGPPTPEPNGVFESFGHPVQPDSLFEAQRRDAERRRWSEDQAQLTQ